METTNTPPLTQPYSSTIDIAIKDSIKESNSKLYGIVVDRFVKQEVDRRADLLYNFIAALAAFKKSVINKVSKPDITTYSPEGVATPSFSAAAFQAKEKAFEKLNKAENALEKALTNGDNQSYQTIESLTKELSPSQGQEKPKDKEPEVK
ncbi:MAG: hypothetical protein EKK57_02785 [Proteobacteria bacterium]|nr:MAG: hypothetical protein EKK57_02785 [Pseudomonadota bacterium]